MAGDTEASSDADRPGVEGGNADLSGISGDSEADEADWGQSAVLPVGGYGPGAYEEKTEQQVCSSAGSCWKLRLGERFIVTRKLEAGILLAAKKKGLKMSANIFGLLLILSGIFVLLTMVGVFEAWVIRWIKRDADAAEREWVKTLKKWTKL